MRFSPFVTAIALGTAMTLVASPAQAQDQDRSVEDGGIHVDGWKGRIDRRAASQGMSINDSRMAMEGSGYRLSIGPAAFLWSDANTASGNYEVGATFREHAMNAGHPHPYGIFIGGSDLESESERLLYCVVYADGTYLMRAFHGSEVTTVQAKSPSDAINKADAEGEATNQIALRVQDGTVSCHVNGTEVGSFGRDQVVGPDLLSSTDGIYGIRASHNLEVSVTGFGMTQR